MPALPVGTFWADEKKVKPKQSADARSVTSQRSAAAAGAAGAVMSHLPAKAAPTAEVGAGADAGVGGTDTFWAKYFDNPLSDESGSSSSGGDGVDQVVALATEYTSGRQFNPPPVDSMDDALDVALHVMAKHYFQGRELEMLPMVARLGGKIPMRTITGPNGVPVTMLKFDEELLRSLASSDFFKTPERFTALICFCCYAITVRKYINRWTAALMEIEHYRQGVGTVAPPSGIPDINNPEEMKLDPGKPGFLVYQSPMMKMAQGMWEWPAVTNAPANLKPAFNALETLAKGSLSAMGAPLGDWLVKDAAKDKTELETLYTAVLNKLVSDQVPGECIPKRLATAAYLSEVITAIYAHMMHVLRAYAETKILERGRPTNAPLVADPNLLRSGGTGPGQMASCPPNTVPAFKIGPEDEDRKAFEAAAGTSGKTAGMPLPPSQAVSKDTGTLMPGVVVDGCLPGRPLSSVMGGAAGPAIVGVGGGPGVALPSGPMSNIFSVGGVRYGKVQDESAPRFTPQQTLSALNVSSRGGGGPLFSTYAQELSGGPPPGFHAVVITPPPPQP
jgi:hypothetical protein